MSTFQLVVSLEMSPFAEAIMAAAAMEFDGAEIAGFGDIAAADHTVISVIADLVAIKQLGLCVDPEAPLSDLFSLKVNDASSLVTIGVGIGFQLIRTGINCIPFHTANLKPGLAPIIDTEATMLPAKMVATFHFPIRSCICRSGSGDEECRRGQSNGSNSCFDQFLEHETTMRR